MVRTRHGAVEESGGERHLSEYELQRLERIDRNEAYLASLGLGSGRPALVPARATKRGVAKRKRVVDQSQLRRSSRLREGAEKAGPEEVAEERVAPRGDASLEEDEAEDAAAIADALRAEAAAADAMPYEASVQSLRLASRDVAKTSRGGKGTAVAFHPRLLVVASGDSGGHLGIWDVEKEPFEVRGHHTRPIAALAWRDDSLLSAGYEGTVRRLDFARARSVVLAAHDELFHAAFDDDLVYTAHGDGTLRLVDCRARAPAWSFEAHEAKAAHVALRPGGAQLASAGNDAAVKTWDLRAVGRKTPLWRADHDRSVRGCAWTRDGDALCSVSYDNSLKIYDQSALASTHAASTRCVTIFHDNATGRFLTPFKPVFDPHAPYPVVVLGSLQRPRCLDLLVAPASASRGAANLNPLRSALLRQLHDDGNLFAAVSSIHDVHPVHHVIAAINNSARVSIWRRPPSAV